MKSRHAARLIFKIDFKPVKTGSYYFDMTTLVLTKLVLREINKDDRVLDMGTGTSSIIGLTLWKQCGCYVVCSDINPEIVSMAQENVEFNQAPIQVKHSNLFENIEEDFDVVVFNPPYVPTKKGTISNLSKQFQSQWDGGEDGSSIVKQFFSGHETSQKPHEVQTDALNLSVLSVACAVNASTLQAPTHDRHKVQFDSLTITFP